MSGAQKLEPFLCSGTYCDTQLGVDVKTGEYLFHA